MDRSRLWRICKNYISIVLTISVMIYFGFANIGLFRAFASEQQTSETVQEAVGSVSSGDVENADGSVSSGDAESTGGSVSSGDAESTGGSVSSGDAESTGGSVSSGDAESTGGSVSSGDVEESYGTVSDGDACITYTYRVTDTEAENYGEEVTESTFFGHLSEVFAGMKSICDRMLENGETEYVPTVKLCRDIELSETIQNVDNVSFVLDMQGHMISLQNEAYLDLGAGTITFTDRIAETAENPETDSGGIIGNGTKLFTGSGKWIFCQGWYENPSGNLFGEAAEITVQNGYFISPAGRLADKAEFLNIEGGFFSYQEALGLLAQGVVKFPDEKAFAGTTQILRERELTGYCLTEPDYVVSVGEASTDEAGNPVTIIRKIYYKEFAKAWEKAASLSIENSGSVATIGIFNTQITGISLSQSYTLYAGENGTTAAVMLDGMNFTRQPGYDGNLFTVNAGRLILNDCVLDGTMETQSVAQASSIRVNNGVLVLNGSEGTVICNNISIPNALTKDVGAGIYLASGTQLSISGKVSVRDNLLYHTDVETEGQRTTPRNVYMEEGAAIELAGNLTADSKIGVSHDVDVIAGLTSFGKMKDTYLAEILSNTPANEQPDVSELLSVFVSDQYASYFSSFDEQSNLFFWDRDVLLLPEAGVLRVEFLLLLMGLFGFLVRNIPKINRCKAAERYIMVLSVLCFLCGTGIGFFHIRQEQRISDANMAVIRELYSTKTDLEVEVTMLSPEKEEEIVEEISQEAEVESVNCPVVPEDGRNYYGVIEIPALDIKLPVLADYSDADMKTTPCVYHGGINEDNLVIVGHNYESQFGRLNEIEMGTAIWLTLTDGTVFSFRVCESEELNPDQVEEMLNPGWDMTVFTCNYAGDKRVAVRCKIED